MNSNIGENAKRDWLERKEAERLEQDKHEAEKRKAQEEQEAQKSDWQKDLEGTQSVADALATTGQTQQEIEDALFGSSVSDDEKSTQEDAMAPKLGAERLRVMKSLDDNAPQEEAFQGNQETPETDVEGLDNKMRDVAKQASEQGNEEASEWLSHDEKAQSAQRHVKVAERELERRQSDDYTVESYDKLVAAHLAFAEHMGEKRPHIFQTKEREEYDEKMRSLQGNVNDAKAEHYQRMENVKPDELARLQSYIAHEMRTHEEASQHRSSIASLPSEVAQENAQVDVKKYVEDLGKAWSPSDGRQEVKDYEEEIRNQVQVQSRVQRQQM